jgi:hypothetical protein
MILPDVLWMARGGLLDWVSAALRVGVSVVLLLMGWWFYRSFARIGGVLWRGGRALPPRMHGHKVQKLGMQEPSGGNV